MTEYEWTVPFSKPERQLGRKRKPCVECYNCGQKDMTVFKKRKTDWSQHSIIDVINPFCKTNKVYRLLWTCGECSFTERYIVNYDPEQSNTVEMYDSNHIGSEQTKLSSFDQNTSSITEGYL